MAPPRRDALSDAVRAASRRIELEAVGKVHVIKMTELRALLARHAASGAGEQGDDVGALFARHRSGELTLDELQAAVVRANEALQANLQRRLAKLQRELGALEERVAQGDGDPGLASGRRGAEGETSPVKGDVLRALYGDNAALRGRTERSP